MRSCVGKPADGAEVTFEFHGDAAYEMEDQRQVSSDHCTCRWSKKVLTAAVMLCCSIILLATDILCTPSPLHAPGHPLAQRFGYGSGSMAHTSRTSGLSGPRRSREQPPPSHRPSFPGRV